MEWLTFSVAFYFKAEMTKLGNNFIFELINQERIFCLGSSFLPNFLIYKHKNFFKTFSFHIYLKFVLTDGLLKCFKNNFN